MNLERIVGGYNLADLKSGPVKEAAEYSYLAAAEGSVLLKNEKGTLPLKAGQTVSVFGRIQSTYYKSGTGSGGMVNVDYLTNILDSLRATESVNVNEELASVYEEWIKQNPFEKGVGWAAEPWCQEEMPLTDEIVKSAADKSDVAVIIIGRTAGEDKDNYNGEGSYLLTSVERDMVKKVTSQFDKVCVVLNVGNIIDTAFVDEFGVDALLYVWQGGFEGGRAAASVLCGEIAPSGKLTDTVAKKVADYASDKNFGGRFENIYEEDIYVGYRYFETFNKDAVVYPFGFGLGYTTFDVKVDSIEKGDNITVKATVTNTGDFSGKETVQVYYEAPQGVLGKPTRALAGFKKTALLQSGESETVEITFPISRMASYDDGGYTGNRSCYVLEAGDYNFYVGTDVRSAEKCDTLNIAQTTVIERLTTACTPNKDFEILHPVKTENGGFEKSYIPVYRGKLDVKARIANEMPADIAYTGDKGYKLIDVKSGKCTLDEFIAQLSDEDLAAFTVGEGMNSPKVTPGTAAAFSGITDNLVGFGVPACCCTDGPSGLRLDDGAVATSIPNGTNLACTWNPELVEQLFVYLGIEAYSYNIDTLLGPGINIHRHPLNGRNFEYLSEDPYLTGVIAGAMTKGFAKSGSKTTIKHLVTNNQEYYRYNSNSELSERALREIYLKPFEICVKDYGAKSIMTTYNPTNGYWNASNYELTTTILRDEWGYDGIVMTDWWAVTNEYPGASCEHKKMHSMIRSQNDMFMVATDIKDLIPIVLSDLNDGKITRGQLQRCAKNVLNFTLDSNIFEKFVRNGCKPINPGRTDLDGLVSFSTQSNPTLGMEYEIDLPEDTTVVFAFDYKSEHTVTAQLPVAVIVDGKQMTTLMGNGTENALKRMFSRSVTIPAGKHTVKFDYSPKMITVVGIDFMK